MSSSKRQYTISELSRSTSRLNATAGHAKLIKHGEGRSGAETAEYKIWKGMRRRCKDPKHKNYKEYGGRGIAVCERWAEYANFLADMKRRPSPKHTLERKDNNGNYEPGNCEWATRSRQSNNCRSNRLYTMNGETLNIAQWAAKTGIAYSKLFYRLNNGFSITRALDPKTMYGPRKYRAQEDVPS